MKKILVTGITGFVGRHLRAALKPPEYSVFGTSWPDEPPPSTHDVFHVDLRVERDVFNVVKQVQPDGIFHLAALSNVRHSWERMRETLETNFMGTYYLLEAVKKFSVGAKMLFASSSDIYGFGGSGEPGSGAAAGRVGGSAAGAAGRRVLTEADRFQISNPYALSKVGGELLCDFYTRIEGVNVVITRSFPHTGPGQSPDFVCSDWARQIVFIERGKAEPVIRVGNLDGVRDYSDVRDTAAAYSLLMVKGRSGGVYNVCSGRGISLRTILDMLLSLSPARVKVEVDASKFRKTDIPALLGDNTRLREDTGWAPRIPLEQTLRELLEDWRKKV